MNQVHKEAHFKNGATPTKKDPSRNELETTFNEEDEMDPDTNDNTMDEEEEDEIEINENETDCKTDTTEVMEDKINFSMTQDNFIDDGTVARVI